MECLLSEKSTAPQKAVSSSPAVSSPAQEPTDPSRPPVQESEPKVGSAIAELWLKVHQDARPPASIPSTLMSLHQCPQCSHTLVAAAAAQWQVCNQCGWTDKPQDQPQPAAEDVDEGDLLRLLEQAASESLENMKPRKKRQ